MSAFINTPPNLDLLDTVLRDPYSKKWTIPVLTFNTKYVNPYYGEIDPLNEDPRYQKSVIKHFYLRLREKWLYNDPKFIRLLKYFEVKKNGDKGTVKLIDNIENTNRNIDKIDQKYIFNYIEKYFVSKRFVDRVLREYVGITHIKWYDLFYNTDTLKDLFAHKLKKLITTTIYELSISKK